MFKKKNNNGPSIILKNRLKEVREEHNLTQKQLAEELGVTERTISSIEDLTFVPSAKLAFILAVYFDMSADDLFHLAISKEEDKDNA